MVMPACRRVPACNGISVWLCQAQQTSEMQAPFYYWNTQLVFSWSTPPSSETSEARVYVAKLLIRSVFGRLSCHRIQDEFAAVAVPTLVAEVEHLGDCIGDTVETPLADALPSEPVIFDESQHRSLIRHRVVYKVLLRPRGYNEQRLARAIAAAAESVEVRRVDARQRRGRVPAGPRTREEIG